MIDKLLDYARFALYAVLVVSFFALYQAWQKDHPVKPSVEPTAASMSSSHVVPNVTNTAASLAATTNVNTTANAKPATPADQMGNRVTITTDVLKVVIDTRGGDIVESSLIKYPETLNSNQSVVLFNDNPSTKYVAESGLLSKQGPDTTQEQALYTAAQTEYSLQPNQQDLTVKLSWQKEGVLVTKTFTFTRDSYEVKVGYDIQNQSSKPWQGNLYTQLLRTNTPPTHNGSGMTR